MIVRAHKRVEVDTGATGCFSMKNGIDVIRATFKGLCPDSAVR